MSQQIKPIELKAGGGEQFVPHVVTKRRINMGKSKMPSFNMLFALRLATSTGHIHPHVMYCSQPTYAAIEWVLTSHIEQAKQERFKDDAIKEDHIYFAGIPIILDPEVPEGHLIAYREGEELGRIVGIEPWVRIIR